jgi:molecular chaperone GrpE (heat shock protein)
MSLPDESLDEDFDAQMRGLFEQAEKVIESRARRAESARADLPPEAPSSGEATEEAGNGAAAPSEEKGGEGSKRNYPTLPQMLRPLVLGMEAITRAMGENSSILHKLDKAADLTGEAQNGLPRIVLGLREVLEQKNGINQRMFDALHQELKGYKDSFLLETVHRPIIRDLISLYDDLAEIHRQIGNEIGEQIAAEMAGPAAEALLQRMKILETNVGHKLEFIVEVLARLEVSPMPPGRGKLEKQTQRAVAVEMTSDPEEDTLIVRTVKRGFVWRDRVLRAEEVVMKKCKQASDATSRDLGGKMSEN